MNWEMVIALVIAVPVSLFPAAYVWYLNIGGLYSSFKAAKAKRLAYENEIKEAINLKISAIYKQGR